MNLKKLETLVAALLFTMAAAAEDDDKSTMFNPVEHAVISQTIAPDARAAGMGDVGAATTPTSTHSTGTPPSTPSVSAAPA